MHWWFQSIRMWFTFVWYGFGNGEEPEHCLISIENRGFCPPFFTFSWYLLVYNIVYWTTVSDRLKKRELISQSVISLLEKKDSEAPIRMKLYTTIYESNNDDLLKNLSVIDVSEVLLSRDEAHIVGSLIARSGDLKSVDLSFCDIDDVILEIITKCFKDQIQVRFIVFALTDCLTANFSNQLRSKFSAKCSVTGNLEFT